MNSNNYLLLLFTASVESESTSDFVYSPGSSSEQQISHLAQVWILFQSYWILCNFYSKYFFKIFFFREILL